MTATAKAPTASNVTNAREAAAYIAARIDAYIASAASHVDEAEVCNNRARHLINTGRPTAMIDELQEAVIRHNESARRLLAEAARLRERLDACRVTR